MQAWTAAHYGRRLSGAIRHTLLINALSDGVSTTQRPAQAERGERKGYCLTKECLNGRRRVSDDDREDALPLAETVGG